MNKNKIILVIAAIVMIFGIISGLIIYLSFNQKIQTAKLSAEENMVEKTSLIENNENNVNISRTNEIFTTISDNYQIILEKEYLECGHVTQEIINENIEGKTKEKIQEQFINYEIKEFSENQVVLLSKIDSKCDEHYKIQLENSVVTIFKENADGTYSVLEHTNKHVDYLTELDKQALTQGVIVVGTSNLNALLEDFE